jgi:periplasmic divalent cation tolerance protein
VVSVCRHLDEIGEGEEYAAILSSTRDAFSRLEALLKERHPWENPGITAVELVATSEEYAR